MMKKLTDQLKRIKEQLLFFKTKQREEKNETPALHAGPYSSPMDISFKGWPTVFLTFKKKSQDLFDLLKRNPFKSLKNFKNPFDPSHEPGGPKRKNKRSLNWNFEKFTNDLFAVQARDKVHKGFLVILILSLSYTGGKLMALLLQSPEIPNLGKTLNLKVEDPYQLAGELTLIKAKNLFKTSNDDPNKAPSRPAIDKNIICKKSDKTSGLPITLVNTVVLQDSVKSLAAVQIRGGAELKSLREGEKIEELAEIGKIDRLNIVIKNLETGECEQIANNYDKTGVGGPPLNVLGPSDGQKLIQSQKVEGINQDGNHITISKNLLNEKMQDMENILTQARAIQMQNPDGTLSFKVVEIVPGSIFSFLGLQNEDKITQINGKKIMGLNDVMNLFGNIQNVDNLQLTVVKDDGNEQNLEYEFIK